MKKQILLLCILCLFTSCSQSSGGWTVAECNKNMANALDQIDKYNAKVTKSKIELAEAQRSGNQNQKTIDRLLAEISNNKGLMEGNVQYIENDVFGQCDQNAFDETMIKKLEEVKKIITEKEQTFEAEGMPDIRVTQITSEFIPYVDTANGGCEGPFMDINFTVQNYGEDFPRKVDWEAHKKLFDEGKISTALEDTRYFALSYSLNLPQRTPTDQKLDIARSELKDGVFKSGQSQDFHIRIRIYDNEKEVEVTAKMGIGANALKIGELGLSTPYVETFEVPIWDIYTYSVAAIGKGDLDKGTYEISLNANLLNKGKTPTPGPVDGTFGVHNDENKSSIALWNGQTVEPLTDRGNILGDAKESDVRMESDAVIKSSIHLLCPNGKPGQLSDGDTTNNRRTLKPGEGSVDELDE